MSISVIIPTYNKAFYLDLTLCGFSNQTFSDFEIVIVNDGGDDHTEEVVNSYKDKLNIKYVYQNNGGRSKARNIGLSSASEEIIIFSDDDRIPVSAFVESHLKSVENNPRTISIGLKETVLSRYTSNFNTFYVDPNENVIKCFSDFFKRNPDFLKRFQPDVETILITKDMLENDLDATLYKHRLYTCVENFLEVVEQHGVNFENFFMGWVLGTTGNMAFNRSNSTDIWFDEIYKGWGIEDNDFSYQLDKAGYDFQFNYDAVNFHQEHPRSEQDREKGRENIHRFLNKFHTEDIVLYGRAYNGEMKIVDANRLYIQNNAV